MNRPWIFIGRTDAEAQYQYFGHLMWRINSLEKTLMLEKIEGRKEEKGMAEDEMVGCHHWLNGCEFEQALGVGEGQGSLACCSPWGHKESDMIERLNNNIIQLILIKVIYSAETLFSHESKGVSYHHLISLFLIELIR